MSVKEIATGRKSLLLALAVERDEAERKKAADDERRANSCYFRYTSAGVVTISRRTGERCVDSNCKCRKGVSIDFTPEDRELLKAYQEAAVTGNNSKLLARKNVMVDFATPEEKMQRQEAAEYDRQRKLAPDSLAADIETFRSSGHKLTPFQEFWRHRFNAGSIEDIREMIVEALKQWELVEKPLMDVNVVYLQQMEHDLSILLGRCGVAPPDTLQDHVTIKPGLFGDIGPFPHGLMERFNRFRRNLYAYLKVIPSVALQKSEKPGDASELLSAMREIRSIFHDIRVVKETYFSKAFERENESFSIIEGQTAEQAEAWHRREKLDQEYTAKTGICKHLEDIAKRFFKVQSVVTDGLGLIQQKAYRGVSTDLPTIGRGRTSEPPHGCDNDAWKRYSSLSPLEMPASAFQLTVDLFNGWLSPSRLLPAYPSVRTSEVEAVTFAEWHMQQMSFSVREVLQPILIFPAWGEGVRLNAQLTAEVNAFEGWIREQREMSGGSSQIAETQTPLKSSEFTRLAGSHKPFEFSQMVRAAEFTEVELQQLDEMVQDLGKREEFLRREYATSEMTRLEIDEAGGLENVIRGDCPRVVTSAGSLNREHQEVVDYLACLDQLSEARRSLPRQTQLGALWEQYQEQGCSREELISVVLYCRKAWLRSDDYPIYPSSNSIEESILNPLLTMFRHTDAIGPVEWPTIPNVNIVVDGPRRVFDAYHRFLDAMLDSLKQPLRDVSAIKQGNHAEVSGSDRTQEEAKAIRKLWLLIDDAIGTKECYFGSYLDRMLPNPGNLGLLPDDAENLQQNPAAQKYLAEWNASEMSSRHGIIELIRRLMKGYLPVRRILIDNLPLIRSAAYRDASVSMPVIGRGAPSADDLRGVVNIDQRELENYLRMPEMGPFTSAHQQAVWLLEGMISQSRLVHRDQIFAMPLESQLSMLDSWCDGDLQENSFHRLFVRLLDIPGWKEGREFLALLTKEADEFRVWLPQRGGLESHSKMPSSRDEKLGATEEQHKSDDPIILPKWDSKTRRLTYGGELVKYFQKSAGMIYLLDEFEREGWPRTLNKTSLVTSDQLTDFNRAAKCGFQIRKSGDGISVEWFIENA